MKILIVEDHKLARITLTGFLKGHEIEEAETLASAENLIRTKEYDLVFLDLDLDVKLAGLELAKICKERGFYSVILTGHEEDHIMKEGYLNGARDYLFKPVKKCDVDFVLNSFLVFDSEKRIDQLIKSSYITNHAPTIAELDVIKRVYLSNKPILIKGPTGTGKSVVAKLVKEACRISDSKFMSINCAQFSDNLIESELFGHKKGAFTGAFENKVGLLEKANGGMIFLDEIHSLTISAQKKLMKAIEEKCFYPVGSTTLVHSDFRVVTATCEDLAKLIEDKEFRADFYARISHIQLQLYALKDRPSDILPLIQFYASNHPRKFTIGDEAKELLLTLPFKSNTRDIDALVDYWTRNAIGIVGPEHIPSQFYPEAPKPKTPKLTRAQKKLIEEIGLKGYLDSVRDEIILNYLEDNNQNRLQTAKILKISDRAIRHAFNKKPETSVELPQEVEYENTIQ